MLAKRVLLTASLPFTRTGSEREATCLDTTLECFELTRSNSKLNLRYLGPVCVKLVVVYWSVRDGPTCTQTDDLSTTSTITSQC